MAHGGKREPRESRRGCWLALLIAAVPVVGSILIAGPDTVWQNIEIAIGRYPPPIILRVLAADKQHAIGTFVVTIKNPSERAVIVTGYRVSPSSMQPAAATIGSGDVNRVEGRDEPEPCSTGKRKQAIQPAKVIEPNEAIELTIRPWTSTEMCNYDLSILSDHGQSASTSIGAWDTGPLLRSISPEEWERLRRELTHH